MTLLTPKHNAKHKGARPLFRCAAMLLALLLAAAFLWAAAPEVLPGAAALLPEGTADNPTRWDLSTQGKLNVTDNNSCYLVTTSIADTVAGGVAASQAAISVAASIKCTIILKDVAIDVSATSGACAFHIADRANATVNLLGSNTFKSGENHAALDAPLGSILVVNGPGSLSATGGRYGAGIGAGNNTGCGTITINGGAINAFGGERGPGIGGFQNMGSVTINGGAITATGGPWGAGIGGGQGSSCQITLYGGQVSAQGGSCAAGIGGGERAMGSALICGGVIHATGGNGELSTGGGAGIGAGAGAMGSVNIYSGIVTAQGGSAATSTAGGGGGAGIGGGGGSGNANINGGNGGDSNVTLYVNPVSSIGGNGGSSPDGGAGGGGAGIGGGGAGGTASLPATKGGTGGALVLSRVPSITATGAGGNAGTGGITPAKPGSNVGGGGAGGSNNANTSSSGASQDNATAVLPSGKDIMAYSINGYAGTITGNTIAVSLPTGFDAGSLIPSYKLSPGASLQIDNTASISGITPLPNTDGLFANNTQTFSITVTAANSTIKTYTLTVTLIPLTATVDFTATRVAGGKAADLTWSDVPEAAGYNVYCDGVLWNTQPLLVTQCVLDRLTATKDYTVEMAAVNWLGGEGPRKTITLAGIIPPPSSSSAASTAPPPAPPSPSNSSSSSSRAARVSSSSSSRSASSRSASTATGEEPTAGVPPANPTGGNTNSASGGKQAILTGSFSAKGNTPADNTWFGNMLLPFGQMKRPVRITLFVVLVCAVALLIWFLFMLWRRRKKQEDDEQEGDKNDM